MDRNALIIDDNPNNLEVLALMLKREGLNAVKVQFPNRITEALDQIDSLEIIFLDLEFPNIDGFQILETLRADERLADKPIVAYSVHISELNEARAAGFNSFIGKPLSVERFPQQLRRILNGEAVWEVS